MKSGAPVPSDPPEMIQGPMTAGQIEGTVAFLNSGAEIQEGRLVVPPEHAEWAHGEMERDLANRATAAAHNLVDSTSTTADPATAESAPTGPERYLSQEELAWGRQAYRFVEQATTGDNGSSFLFGKYPHGSVPGLPSENEYQSAVYNGDGTYRHGVYQPQVPDFLLAASIAQAIDDRFATTNFFVMYPSRTYPGQMVCSYNSWQDARSLAVNQKLSPVDTPMAFNFEIPEAHRDSFLDSIAVNPRLPEALLQASPYGRLLRSANDSGPVVRNQAQQLLVIHLGSGWEGTTSAARDLLKRVGTGETGTVLALEPPIGETVK